jgi:hypothetical protein
MADWPAATDIPERRGWRNAAPGDRTIAVADRAAVLWLPERRSWWSAAASIRSMEPQSNATALPYGSISNTPYPSTSQPIESFRPLLPGGVRSASFRTWILDWEPPPKPLRNSS